MVAGEHGVGVGEDLSDPVKFGQTLNRLLHDEEQLSAMKKQYEGCRNKFSFESQRAALEMVLGEHGSSSVCERTKNLRMEKTRVNCFALFLLLVLLTGCSSTSGTSATVEELPEEAPLMSQN